MSTKLERKIEKLEEKLAIIQQELEIANECCNDKKINFDYFCDFLTSKYHMNHIFSKEIKNSLNAYAAEEHQITGTIYTEPRIITATCGAIECVDLEFAETIKERLGNNYCRSTEREGLITNIDIDTEFLDMDILILAKFDCKFEIREEEFSEQSRNL